MDASKHVKSPGAAPRVVLIPGSRMILRSRESTLMTSRTKPISGFISVWATGRVCLVPVLHKRAPCFLCIPQATSTYQRDHTPVKYDPRPQGEYYSSLCIGYWCGYEYNNNMSITLFYKLIDLIVCVQSLLNA